MSPQTVCVAAPSALRAVFCVDDNEWIGESVGRILRRSPIYRWGGWFPLYDQVEPQLRSAPDAILLLDVDVPGQDTFDVLERIRSEFPDLRVLMLSGHVHITLIDRALAAGAWGYISKNDDTSEILRALEAVAAGAVAFSPSVLEHYHRS
jgi:two-component system, NarL family, invasion response regulator UvrY